MHSLRSSGWTPLSQPSPRSCSSVLPVNSSHGRLKSMQRPSGPAIQIMTGAASAMSVNRFSLSSSAVSAWRPIRTMANISANRPKRCTSSSGHSRSTRSMLTASAPAAAPPMMKGTSATDFVPNARMVERSVAASSGNSWAREKQTT